MYAGSGANLELLVTGDALLKAAGAALEVNWNQKFAEYAAAFPDLAAETGISF